MGYRIIQWGTGNVGKHSLRCIIERPDMELVGLKVYSEEKAGKEVGALVGLPNTGVIATTSLEDILGIDADCVAYNALGAIRGWVGFKASSQERKIYNLALDQAG